MASIGSQDPTQIRLAQDNDAVEITPYDPGAVADADSASRYELVPISESGRPRVWKKAQKRPRFALKKALQLLSERFLNVLQIKIISAAASLTQIKCAIDLSGK